MVMVTTTKEKT